ncbi:MAG: hypothetical protein QM597_01990 [Aeromicrobium sp.]|uniref:hypothetical protein n=1 Tax=Aeromicrobium sp. TaxID=1871063 RepID=UPI0039E49C7C
MRKPVRPLLAVTMFAVVAAVCLSGCGDDADTAEPVPTPTGVASDLVPGACVAAQGEAGVLGDTTITDDAIVDCADPHIYEVVAAQDMPGQYIAGTAATEDDRTRLQAALDGTRTDSVQIAFASFARAYCDIAVQRAAGLDGDAEIAGTDIATLQVRPMSHDSVPYAVLPQSGWTEQPSLLCVNRFVEVSADPAAAPVAAVTGPQTALLMSADLPLAQRLCFSFDATGIPADASCEATHDAEYTVTFDATSLLDAEQLAASSGDTYSPLPEDVQERLDEACDDALDLVMGDDRDEAVAGHALRGSEGWGAGGQTNVVNCYGMPEDPAVALPAGSLFGLGETKVAVVARG